MDGVILTVFIKKGTEIMVADLNLLGSVGNSIALAILSVCFLF